MELPWNCSTCGFENMIDVQNLSEWPMDRLICAQGFTCEKCEARVAVSYTSVSLRDAEKKLSRYRPDQTQFRFLFAKLLRKVSGMNEKMTSR